MILQQDNASIHTSRSTKQWLDIKNIEVLDWPARSPDLNPIKNLWRILVRSVYANGNQYRTVEELKNAILKAWNEVPTEVLLNLARSMPN
ncbi:hypothetical protein L596_021207 [Steinernema carpocapsae]|uniref:Tc1-like transposase DDE domain-containing protein n=1 Tax=Steinernema carpocapsae TaxID=34508 RepID=A0A4U5MWW9_STECR|nr:hypothetical protein L596_021207 [Steinernema carpocapsae]